MVKKKSDKMPEITLHFKKRWLERIKGVTNPSKTQIESQDTTIVLEIAKAFIESTFLTQDVFSDNHKSIVNYYIFDDIIMIADSAKTVLITCFRVELPFPDPIVKQIIETSIQNIARLKDELHEYKGRILDELVSIQNRVEANKKLVTELELSIAEDIAKEKELRIPCGHLESETRNYAKILCNSLRLKQDMLEGAFL